MRKMKVYGGSMIKSGRENRVVIAATSWKRVAEIVGLPLGYLRNYWAVTGNDGEIAAAMAQPETMVVIPTQ